MLSLLVRMQHQACLEQHFNNDYKSELEQVCHCELSPVSWLLRKSDTAGEPHKGAGSGRLAVETLEGAVARLGARRLLQPIGEANKIDG